MALTITDAEDDEMDMFIETVLNAYKDGLCTLSDARGSIAQVMAAALMDGNFVGELRGHTKMFLRNA